jgi:hypothetical protein
VYKVSGIWTHSCHGPDAQVRNSVFNKVPNATADSGVSSSRSGRGLDGPADAEVSKFLFAQGPDEYAVFEGG